MNTRQQKILILLISGVILAISSVLNFYVYFHISNWNYKHDVTFFGYGVISEILPSEYEIKFNLNDTLTFNWNHYLSHPEDYQSCLAGQSQLSTLKPPDTVMKIYNTRSGCYFQYPKIYNYVVLKNLFILNIVLIVSAVSIISFLGYYKLKQENVQLLEPLMVMD